MRAIRYSKPDEQGEQPPADKVDGYLERLLKYVPAEIITLFVALSALAAGDPPDEGVLTAAAVLALAVTPLYLYGTSLAVDPAKRPKRIMYVLAPIAFVIWAIYVNEAVRTLGPLNIPEPWPTFLLIAGVFVIPLIDLIADGINKVQNPS